MTERGFIVTDNKFSNYAFTGLSLPSTLNMQYIQNLITLDKKSRSQEALSKLLIDNEVTRILKAKGYGVVDLSVKWKQANKVFADYVNFAFLVIATTPLMSFSHSLVFQKSRENVLFLLDNLANCKTYDKPLFCFAHILCPHPPFVFKESGEKPSIKDRWRLAIDGAKQKRLSYLEQVKFLNNKLKAIIPEIIQSADRPVIIIIEADHGAAYITEKALDSPHPASVKLPKVGFLEEQFGIFSALYVDPRIRRDLSLKKTPINLFRMIFNHYFDAKLDILEEKIFYSTHIYPYDYIDITKQLIKDD